MRVAGNTENDEVDNGEDKADWFKLPHIIGATPRQRATERKEVIRKS